MANGMVYLIGAGPGDPGMLTLRGAELLSRADVVLYDGLSNHQLLDHAPSARHICVGKHGQSRIWRQQEVIDEMLAHARADRRVARLKGGDPAIFARTAEEIAALRAAGIPFEIVPGITAALAAGSFAGIPITDRSLASAVALVTGHEEPGKDTSALDWPALANFPGTLVIYMGVTTAPAWTRALIEAGKPAKTPTAIIRRCSLPDQQSFHVRLDQVSEAIDQHHIRPPAIVIIGPVAELASTTDWLHARPLFGQTIMVTRPQKQAAALAEPLRQLGANVVFQPAIEISAPTNWVAVDQAIDQRENFDVIVFCSHNGVRFFLDRMFAKHRDSRSLAGNTIAAVGTKTAESLRSYGLIADVLPKHFDAETLAAELSESIAGKQVLIIRASRGRDTLRDDLVAAGALVQQVTAYQNKDVVDPDPEIIQLARQAKIDWITITSSATAENLARMLGDTLQTIKIASLSPVTSQTLRRLGYRVVAEANPYTMDGLVESIVTANSNHS